MTGADARLVHLRAAGCSVVLDARAPGAPALLHWGADLGELSDADLQALALARTPAVPHSALDVPVPTSLLPEASRGWTGRPGLSGNRGGAAWSPAFGIAELDRDGSRVVATCADPAAGLTVRTELELTSQGVLRLRHVLRADPAPDGAGPEPGRDGAGQLPAYDVSSLAVVLPLPATAAEVLDLTGRWCRERIPQRRAIEDGTWLREQRHGRTGHDAPLLMVAGTPGFGFRSGDVWGLHVAWSGDTALWAERLPTGASSLGGGELLAPGEVRLGAGEEYSTPEVFAVWSGEGLDGLSARLHQWVRARPEHRRTPRPVVLNTWEAVYFDHDLGRLTRLAEVAAELGVERFVLDDGWFRHRRDDTAGLGDWYVDEQVWPDGLDPLVEHVTGLGMQFGLWVEPEMVNLDSDLARDHPDWVLAEPGRYPPPWRNQQVLDLAQPGAFGYVLERLDDLLTKHDIGYLKWDHNRDLVDAGHDGAAGVRAQTLAVYRLLDELRRWHPDVEIESCSSGGARVDLGVLGRTDRVWASDTNDALERQAIQRWTTLLVPPELVGTHVGPPTSHTTGRTQRLSFRAATALFGHAGMEWDVASASPEERDALARWIAVYKELRALLHSGEVVRADRADDSSWVHGVVAQDRSDAIFAVVQLTTAKEARPAPALLPGLDLRQRYRVEVLTPAGAPRVSERTPPGWWEAGLAGTLVLPGAALATAGLELPVLWPEEALLLRLRAL